MEADDGASAPAAPTRRIQIPSLREVCVNTLIRYRQYLGDVGFMDCESVRAIAWHCSTEQLASIEDETLSGSGRNLEWYTWHLWKRLLTTELGATSLPVTPLESPEPVDYTPPRGMVDPPGDYRALYTQRKEELDERAAAAKERIAAAYQQAQELKESRMAKMIDKLVPSKRQRCTTGTSRGQLQPSTSAFLHKPRADSRSSLMAKPGAQMKLLKDLGLMKAGSGAKPATTVRVIRPAPVSSAALGHSSSLAGAKLLAKATGGQLGTTNVGGSRGLHVEAQPPLAAARIAAVAAAAAARATDASPAAAAAASRAAGRHCSSPALAGSKRQADGEPCTQPQSKVTGASGGPSSSRPDPRVMFPRQPPPQSSSGQSKFVVPSARPLTTLPPADTVPHQRTVAAPGASPRPGGKAARAGGGASRPTGPNDDL